MTEDEMVGWHHRLNGHDFEQTLETVEDREAWRAAVHGVTKGQNNNEIKNICIMMLRCYLSFSLCREFY